MIPLGAIFTSALLFLLLTPPDHLRAEPIHIEGPPDPFTGIYNKEKLNCCAGHDCHQGFTEERFLIKRAGGYIFRPTDERIDEGQVGFSPDANYHICRFDSAGGNSTRKWKAGDIRCLLIPGGGV